MKKIVIILLLLTTLTFCFNNTNYAQADSLSDSVDEQLQNLDLTELENFFNELETLPFGIDFFGCVNKILNGQYSMEYDTIFSYFLNVILGYVKNIAPVFVLIIVISVLCGILQKIKSSYFSNGIGELILFVGLLSIILLLSTQIISIWNNVKNIIENLAKLTEIMSPIILTLMIASGGTVSASVYKPAVSFLSNGVINVVLSIVMPLVATMIIFNVLSNFTTNIKLEKFSELASSIIKWILGLIVAIFGIFISIQGITSATFDGISIKATKFALSNSIPIVGGFIKDGFDLVVAGSVLIKNAIGITVVFGLFYLILSPILYIATFSLLLKLVSALIEPVTDGKISAFCFSMSKCITYLAVSLIVVSFMLFITVLLITFSANAFI